MHDHAASARAPLERHGGRGTFANVENRRAAVAFGAALFALGFAAGYAARGTIEPARAGGGAPPEIARTSEAASATDPGATVARAPDAPREGSARRARADDDVPSKRGDVAVVGNDGTDRRGATGGAAGARRALQSAGALDGGARRLGRLDPTVIRDVVRAHRDQLGFCFAWQLHRRPELRGRITMEFTIGEDGSVTRAEIADDELGDETVLSCFRSVTQRMRFPAPEGGEVDVRYPFVLHPEEEEERETP